MRRRQLVDDLLALSKDLPAEWWGPAKKTHRGAPTGNALLEKAHALAAHLAPSVSGHGGDLALFEAANELSTVLGEDAEAIAEVLRESFNPRCAPPWPERKLLREAERAADREASPERRRARRKRLAREETDAPREADPSTGLPEGCYVANWKKPIPPIEWYCKDLGIAPSDAKVTVIGGLAGAGKGPLANYLAICFALGLKAFGRFQCRRSRVGILDFEGARLTDGRIRAHLRGFGLDARELPGTLDLVGPKADMMLEPTWIADWVERNKIEVLFVDSYLSAMGAQEVDPKDMRYAWLAQYLGELGIVVIIVTHARKPAGGLKGERPSLADIAGSLALGAWAQTGIAVWKPDEEDHNRVRVACMRAPDDSFPTFDIKWSKTGTEREPAWRGEVEGLTGRKAAQSAIGHAKAQRALVALVDTMRLNPYTPQSVSALALAAGIDAKLAGAVLGALARAGVTSHQVDGTGRTAGRFLLIDPEWSPDAWDLNVASGELKRAE